MLMCAGGIFPAICFIEKKKKKHHVSLLKVFWS